MKPFDTATLCEFYRRISAKDGVSVADLRSELDALFQRPRLESDINAYRLGRAPWKKLSDEISPIDRFLRLSSIEAGRIRFPLNDKAPDAWLWRRTQTDPVGIEATIAQGRERYHLAEELVTNGVGRGFIGVPDDAPQKWFDIAMSQERTMHATGQLLSAISSGIRRCLLRKNDPRFAGYILVIQAPLDSLPPQRWDQKKDELREAAASLSFSEIHVISEAGTSPWGFQIK